MEDQFKTIQSLGRKGLISQLSKYQGTVNANVLKSIGDDAAVVSVGDSTTKLISVDTFIEGVDFDLVYTPFQHLGYKIVSTSVSDIYAMNGRPTALLVSLALPNRLSVQMIDDLYVGIDAACKKNGTQLVGGDLTANHNHLVISVTVYGEAEKEKICYRSEAKLNDAICVTGDVGGALAGLRVLMREKKYWEEMGSDTNQPDLKGYEYVVRRQLMPEARLDFIQALNDYNIKPTAMIDITKGIANEVTELCEASGLGGQLFQAALPVALETRRVADEMEEDVDKYALFGGEDLELLFTLPEKDVEKFAKNFNDFVVIGRMIAKEAGMFIQTAEGDTVIFDDLS